ncbi:hypothetical protein [Acanthopleuribacter pedis]|uniref:Uncharacterized protein n=1 Tax=Acanthopleuribacter pedis TaxID=442870 RepID=A0A8J7U7K9_9BACT|nr:hypothetical protein [Acanthopleuribacter pedis]MBO1321516.1 hypothetical protein [Acanthopleuribacter pedis]
MPHRDTPLYSNILLRSRSASLNSDDITAMGALINLEHELNTKMSYLGIARQILDTICAHPHFKKVARVCIAALTDHTNQLRVLDSAMDDQSENLIEPGYSCYVDANGSLFQMNGGQMRILREVSLVIDTFAEQGKPVQRSIRYIHEMGFKSGICLPLVHLGSLRGYIFLNAREPMYFHLARPQDFLLYSHVVFIGRQVHHMACPNEQNSLPPALEAHARWTGEAFEPNSFSEHLSTFLDKRHNLTKAVTVTFDAEQKPFLYAPSLVALTLLDCLEAQGLLAEEQPLEVKVYQDARNIIFEVAAGWSTDSTTIFDQNRFFDLSRHVNDLGWALIMDGEKTALSMNYDPCFLDNPEILYSV